MRDRHAPGHPLHLVQRARTGTVCFSCDADRHGYLRLLEGRARDTACAVHAYVLMANHVHMLITPCVPGGSTHLVESLAACHEWALEPGAPAWGRANIRPVGSRRHFVATMRYIELNPVRAGLVARADEFPWSSHGANAFGASDSLVRPHAFYVALGRSPSERQAAYRALFDGPNRLAHRFS